jgi:hypothetical protein
MVWPTGSSPSKFDSTSLFPCGAGLLSKMTWLVGNIVFIFIFMVLRATDSAGSAERLYFTAALFSSQGSLDRLSFDDTSSAFALCRYICATRTRVASCARWAGTARRRTGDESSHSSLCIRSPSGSSAVDPCRTSMSCRMGTDATTLSCSVP